LIYGVSYSGISLDLCKTRTCWTRLAF